MYTGLSKGPYGVDRISRAIVWDPKFKKLFEADSLQNMRSWVSGRVRDALLSFVREAQMTEVVSIYRQFQLEASHFLPCVEEGHPCGRMHGHSYTIRVHYKGPVDPKKGWFLDWGILTPIIEEVRAKLDHRSLNETIENPTSENVARWIWDRFCRVEGLWRVEVLENPFVSGVSYSR